MLPSRTAISAWVKQFSLLTLRDVAIQLTNARSSGKYVNYGVDDTVKAAGNKRFDIKAAHITIVGLAKIGRVNPFQQVSTSTSLIAELNQLELSNMLLQNLLYSLETHLDPSYQ